MRSVEGEMNVMKYRITFRVDSIVVTICLMILGFALFVTADNVLPRIFGLSVLLIQTPFIYWHMENVLIAK